MSDKLKNLEKLGCLSLTNEQREKIYASIQDTFQLLKSVENIQAEEYQLSSNGTTPFRNSEFTSPDKNGLNIEDGYFLAPKTVKKD